MSTAFTITHTESVDTPTSKRQTVTLEDLCALAKRTKADAKKLLPMFMGGTFNNSGRRRDKDMETITVVFGDCDNGSLSPTEAIEKFKAAKIIGAIITTPSHGPNGHRWRAVCPMHEPIPVEGNPAGFDLHDKLVRVLNGVLGYGVCGTEGKAASRPWYYGSLNDQPVCETYVNDDGVCLDLSNINEVAFPSSASERPPVTPLFSGDAKAEEIGRIVLRAALSFEGGHQGLLGACSMVAPFVRIGALRIEDAADALHERLLETAHRRPEEIPDGEGMRFLDWAVNSDIVINAVEYLETAIQLDEITVTEAARKLGIRYMDATHDFDNAEPLPPDECEDRIVAEHTKKASDRYRFLDYRDLRAMPEPTWLIEGLMPMPSAGVVWGPYASFKSFFMLDLMVHCAIGKDYGGRRVTRGRWIYLVGEGLFDMADRVQAAFTKHAADPDEYRGYIKILPRAVLLNVDSDVDGFIAAAKELPRLDGIPIVGVAIDTLTRSLPGENFNAIEVMTKATASMDKIKDALGCTVCAVGHAGKDSSKGLVGSFATPANSDFEFKTTRTKSATDDVLTVENVKQKYAAEIPPMYFDAVLTQTDGKATIALHERVSAPRKQGKQGGLSGPQIALLSYVTTLAVDGPTTVKAVTDAAIRDPEVTDASSNSDKRKNIRKMLAKMDGNGMVIQGAETPSGRKLAEPDDLIFLSTDPNVPSVNDDDE